MTARELAEKLLGLEDPDLPVVIVVDDEGLFADPKAAIAQFNVKRKTGDCCLEPGRRTALVLYTAYNVQLAELVEKAAP